VSTWKPILLFHLVTLLHLGFDHFFQTASGQSHISTVRVQDSTVSLVSPSETKQTNNVTKEKYMDVLLTKQSGSGTNRGFRTIENQVYTYIQERAGFTYFYPKRKVLSDGVSTAPSWLVIGCTRSFQKATLHLSRLVTGSIDRGCINFFFLFFISLSDFFFSYEMTGSSIQSETRKKNQSEQG
jgi:hypothetical protein